MESLEGGNGDLRCELMKSLKFTHKKVRALPVQPLQMVENDPEAQLQSTQMGWLRRSRAAGRHKDWKSVVEKEETLTISESTNG